MTDNQTSQAAQRAAKEIEMNQKPVVELDCLGRPVGTFEGYSAPTSRRPRERGGRLAGLREIRLLSYVTRIALYIGTYALLLGGWVMTTGASFEHLSFFAYAIIAIFAFVATSSVMAKANGRR
jgi:hypothetical protein